jgi:hypothetical protein
LMGTEVGATHAAAPFALPQASPGPQSESTLHDFGANVVEHAGVNNRLSTATGKNRPNMPCRVSPQREPVKRFEPNLAFYVVDCAYISYAAGYGNG